MNQVSYFDIVIFFPFCAQAFIRGIAAERFCVRNSGVTAVVEVI